MTDKKKQNCSMKFCMNSRIKNKGLTFFAFPREPERCKLWVKACHRDDLEDINATVLNKNYHVCSSHFTSNMFISGVKNRLQANAVPAPSLITSNKSEIPEIECVVIINTPGANNSDEPIKEDANDLPDSSFDKMKTRDESIFADEPRRSSRKFSILRNILQEKQDDIATLVIPKNCEVVNMCRVCCLTNDDMKEIETDYFNNLLIQEMLQHCIDFTVPEEKKLPKKICSLCLVEVNTVYEFIKKCENSKICLENYINKLEEEKIKLELIEDTISTDDGNFDDSYQESSDSDDFEDDEPFTDGKIKRNRCRKCKQSFKVHSALLNHVCDVKTAKNIKQRVYTCKVCQEKFNKLYLLTAHRKSVHKDCETLKQAKDKTPTRCARCDITFTTLADLAAHRQEQHSQTRVIICPVCSKKMSAKAYRSHKEIHFTKLKYCCEYCGKSFSSSSNFNRHMFIHFDMKPHVCDICGRGFRVRAKLTEHRLIHSSERRYMCETCGKSFRQKNVLRAHIQLKRCGKKAGRSGNRGTVQKHECSECTEKFYTIKELKQHRSHTHGTDSKRSEARIYKCEKCEDSFTSTAFLKRHALIHAETKFICPTCNRAFYTMERLQRHESTHDAVKNFICEVCSKAFASKLSLKCHMTVHTGEKRYHCTQCPKTFSQSGQLTSHTRTHTGSRPYQCPYCERAFALNGNLTVHIRTHTGERPYKCKFCEQAFYDSSSAKKHMTVKHGFGAMD